MSIRENLAYLISKNGINPTILAKATGVHQPTIHRILKGESDDPRTATIQPLADYFGTTVEFLRTADAQVLDAESAHAFKTASVRLEDVMPLDVLQVKEYRVRFSAVNGHQVSYEAIEESEPAAYRISWFHKTGIKPKNARRFKVVGDSMEPFLFANDSVLVDTADTDPTRILDGKVYAIRYGNDLRIKRLFRRLDGTLILRSDNPTYKDEEVPPELADEHITILGRVRDKSGAGGL
jgi:phage repressor protein C with HTH and peptisase S24 domain